MGQEWFDSGFDSRDITVLDLTKNGRAELLVVTEFSGGSETGSALSVLTWTGTAMKEVFTEALQLMSAGGEEGWNGNVEDAGNTIEFVLQENGAFGIHVTPFVVRKGKQKLKKPREFAWNPAATAYEERIGKKK